MKGHVHRRCSCPSVKDNAGQIVKDAKGKATKHHRPGCRPAWAYVHDTPGRADGRRRQQTRGGFRTRKDAEAALAAAVTAAHGGYLADPGRQTVGVFLQDWLDGRSKLRPTTRRAYASHLEMYLVPRLGHLKLAALQPGHITTMLREIRIAGSRGRPLQPATVQRIHATLRAGLTHAVRLGLLNSNPARLVELEPAKRPIPLIWSAEELQQFLEHTRGDHLHLLFRLIAYTGLRRGEAVGLHWPAVDLDAGTLRVVQQSVQLGSRTELSEPKTQAGRRIINLDKATCDALREHKVSQQRIASVSHSAQPPETGPVFVREDGQELKPDHVTRTFQRLAKSAGVPTIRVHDLRHTHASAGLAAGIAMKVMQDRLGHASAVITSDIYSHVLPAAQAEAAELIAAALSPTPKPGDTDPLDQPPTQHLAKQPGDPVDRPFRSKEDR